MRLVAPVPRNPRHILRLPQLFQFEPGLSMMSMRARVCALLGTQYQMQPCLDKALMPAGD